MTEQPAEPLQTWETPERVQARHLKSYRVCVQLLAARNEPALIQHVIQGLLDDHNPVDSTDRAQELVRVLTGALKGMTVYVADSARAIDRCLGEGSFDQALRSNLRVDDLVGDL